MLTTGLLSLNVHEALTFDGTEICLHPDLFTAEHAGSTGHHRSNSSARIPLVPTISSEDKLNSQSGTPLLQAGDWIELRVWDVKRGTAATGGHHHGLSASNNLSTILRKRSPTSSSAQSSASGSNPNPPAAPPPQKDLEAAVQQMASPAAATPSRRGARSDSLEFSESSHPPDPSQVAVTAATTAAALVNTNSGSREAFTSQVQASSGDSVVMVEASSTNPRLDTSLTLSSSEGTGEPSAISSASLTPEPPRSLPLSEAEDVPTPLPSPDATASPDVPTKTVITSGQELPPVFPRSRTNTADGALPGNTNKLSSNAKPPMMNQRRKTAQPPSTSPIMSKTRQHYRDISDMTADTLYGGGLATTDSPNLHHSTSSPLDGLPTHSHTSSQDDDDVLSHISSTHTVRLSFVLKVTDLSLTSLPTSARTQVSLLRQVADLYQLSSYDTVTVHKIAPEDHASVLRKVSADFVLVTIKDQFLSRGDMHYFQQSLMGSWIYEGQRLRETARNIQATAWEIRHTDALARSGIVTENTKIAFRSRSARIFWLVQVSAEMYEYASPYEPEASAMSANNNKEENESMCELYFDRWISFVYRLFGRWKELEATHSLTVVFFSRTFCSSMPQHDDIDSHHADDSSHGNHSNSTTHHQFNRDVYGRRYQDHFRMVIENETRTDWDSLVVRLQEAFWNYPREMGWNLSTDANARRPSTASQGNVLEAINVTLNLLQFHYLDRDLHRTGNSLVVVSAGNGVFEVDKKLASITYQRMMDNGIGSDMLSLGLPPLHIAPFFLYVNDYPAATEEGADTSETYYEVPHWMHLSFVSYEDRSHDFEGSEDAPSRDAAPPGLNTMEGFEVVANGSLVPRSFEKNSLPVVASPASSPLHRPKAFSASGNAAASPRKRPKALTQARQLISGRDFRDILEACRPRNAGLLPSPLKALLKMYAMESIEKGSSHEDSDEDEASDTAPVEWGAMNFSMEEARNKDSFRVSRRPVAIDSIDERLGPLIGGMGRSPPQAGLSLSPLQMPGSPHVPDVRGPPLVEDLEQHHIAAERISPASSYNSSSILGVSYDRPFLTLQLSPTLAGISLQRPPSLEFPAASDDDRSESTARSDGSSLGFGVPGDFVSSEKRSSSTREKRVDEKPLNSLKKIMSSHDAGVLLRQPSPTIVAIADQSRVLQGEMDQSHCGIRGPVSSRTASSGSLQQLRSPGRPAAGGLGAALSQYRSSSAGAQQINVDDDIEGSRIGRVGSAARLPSATPGLLQIPEMASKGLSPLLLPPVIGPRTADSIETFPRYRTLDRRFVQGQNELYRQRFVAEGKPIVARNAGMFGTSRQETLPERSGIPTSPPRGPGFTGTVAVSRKEKPSEIRGVPSSPPRGPSGLSTSVSSSDRFGPNRVPRNKSRGRNRTRRKKAFNPFRQQDEDEVLAKKSHNRRRWSHVFPLGEVEFKRHAGPNWKSLTSPAILPLSIDYFPPQNEIDHNYTFSISNISIHEFEKTPYSSNKELMMEMVRQRLTQDYQLVPPSHVNASNYRRESMRDGLANRGRIADFDKEANGNRQFLSMGHRLHVLTYDPSADIVEVTPYNSIASQRNSAANTFKYSYLGYCQETKQYCKIVQTFNKYTAQYNWNKVDRIICGDEDREMRDGMRFRRIMFGIIPDNVDDVAAEQEYIAKFVRLLEYLHKLREKDDESVDGLDIKILSSAERETSPSSEASSKRPKLTLNTMKRFYVQLRSKSAVPEWMEFAVDSTFDTSSSYRIILNWMAASSNKVDAQVQLLQRRCTQYGLNLVPFPQTSISKTVYLNPFNSPAILTIHDKDQASGLIDALLEKGFLRDGTFSTDAVTVAECIDRGSEFDFGERWASPARGQQFVHRSGTLFVRHLTDRNGLVILVVSRNHRFIAKDDVLGQKAHDAFNALTSCVSSGRSHQSGVS